MPLYSSDLPRARATAEHVAAAWGSTDVTDAPRIVLDPRLREISLGDYEGRPWQEFEADTALTAAFAEDPYGTALPNGESLEHLEARVHAAVLDILAPFGVDDTGAFCGNAVSQGDASATDRNGSAAASGEAMSAGAAAAALDGAATAVAADDDMEADTGLPETMDASAVATGFLPVEDSGSACLVAHDGPIRAILNHYLGRAAGEVVDAVHHPRRRLAARVRRRLRDHPLHQCDGPPCRARARQVRAVGRRLTGARPLRHQCSSSPTIGGLRSRRCCSPASSTSCSASRRTRCIRSCGWAA